MKRKELSQARKKTFAELRRLVDEKVVELGQLMPEVKMGRHKNTRAAKMLRREIAQLKTIIREKELLEQTSKDDTKGEQTV